MRPHVCMLQLDTTHNYKGGHLFTNYLVVSRKNQAVVKSVRFYSGVSSAVLTQHIALYGVSQ
jgi:hypothetical protein